MKCPHCSEGLGEDFVPRDRLNETATKNKALKDQLKATQEELSTTKTTAALATRYQEEAESEKAGRAKDLAFWGAAQSMGAIGIENDKDVHAAFFEAYTSTQFEGDTRPAFGDWLASGQENAEVLPKLLRPFLPQPASEAPPVQETRQVRTPQQGQVNTTTPNGSTATSALVGSTINQDGSHNAKAWAENKNAMYTALGLEPPSES